MSRIDLNSHAGSHVIEKNAVIISTQDKKVIVTGLLMHWDKM